MRILVVCGAGASSTFVAQRVRHAAHDQGLAYSAFAGTEVSLPVDLDAADVVLVGPHLQHALERIEQDAARRGAAVVLLPPDIFTDLDGTRTLALVREAVAEPAQGFPAARSTDHDARQEKD
jgi:PTS system cellobiose-specific IIB component